jgi:hypothetical protein
LEVLKPLRETVPRKEAWTLAQWFVLSFITILQLTRHSLSSSFWPKSDYWNGTPTVPLTWLKMTSGCCRILKTFKKKKSDDSTEIYSCSRGVLRRWPLSVGCKYTDTLAIKPFRELHSHTSYGFLRYLSCWCNVIL